MADPPPVEPGPTELGRAPPVESAPPVVERAPTVEDRDFEADRAIEDAIRKARVAVEAAVQDGLQAVEKAVWEGRKAVKKAHGHLPLFHDDRLGGLIDDAWTIPRLLEAALPSESGHERDIYGLDGELGEFPFPINEKELRLVREAATAFIKLLKDVSEDHMLAILDKEMDIDIEGGEDGLIGDNIFLKEGGIEDVNSLARSFSRRRFGDKAFNDKLRDQLRDNCVQQIADPQTKLGRRSRELVHNLNDLVVDLAMREDAMRRLVRPEVPLQEIRDTVAIAKQAEAQLQAQPPTSAAVSRENTGEPRESGSGEAQRRSKAPRTTQ